MAIGGKGKKKTVGDNPKPRTRRNRTPSMYPWWRKRLKNPEAQEDYLKIILGNPGTPIAALGGTVLYFLFEYGSEFMNFTGSIAGLLGGAATVAEKSLTEVSKMAAAALPDPDPDDLTGDESEAERLEKERSKMNPMKQLIFDAGAHIYAATHAPPKKNNQSQSSDGNPNTEI